MPKSLITGGAGFIGSHIADMLIGKGHNVVIVDNLSTGVIANVNPAAKFYETDIRGGTIAGIFRKEKPDFVFHLAAQISVRKSVEDPVSDAEVNVVGSLNVLENAAKNGVKKIIFASTGGAMYGDADILPTPEECAEKPLSPYGIDKLFIEKTLSFYKRTRNMDYCILRLSNVYGPRQNGRGEAGVIAIFIEKFLEGGQPVINGRGEQTRDYVYVEDVARAFALAQERRTKSDKFNIGTGIETSVSRIFDMIVSDIGTDAAKKHCGAKNGEQQRSCLSWEKAKEELGWTPEYDIGEGIEKTVEWFIEARKSCMLAGGRASSRKSCQRA